MALASLGLIGSGTGDGSDVLTIPVTTSVPRSDPAGGASIVLIIPFLADGVGAISSVSDDAPTDPFYSTHLYTDGLNHYGPSPTSPHGIPLPKGLILNPLVGGTNSITVQLGGPTTNSQALAFAYTGVQVNNQSFPSLQVPDQSTDVWFDLLSANNIGPFGRITDNPHVSAQNWFWSWLWNADAAESITMGDPFPTAYPSWLINTGTLALIWTTGGFDSPTPPGDFVPNDGSWSQVAAITDAPDGAGNLISTTVFEKPVSPVEADDDLGGTWTTTTWFANDGAGLSLIGGLGPIWATVPPPPVVGPYFNDVMIRAA